MLPMKEVIMVQEPLSSSWQNIANCLNVMLHIRNRGQPFEDLNAFCCLKTILIALETLFYSFDRPLHFTKGCSEMFIMSSLLESHGCETIFLIFGVHEGCVALDL